MRPRNCDLGVVVGFAEGLAGMVTGAVALVVTIVRVAGDIALATIGAVESALADAGLIASADDSLMQPYGDDLWDAYLLWHDVQYFDAVGFLQSWWENFQQLSPEEKAIKAGNYVGEVAAFLATWEAAGSRIGTILPPPPGPAPQLAAELATGGGPIDGGRRGRGRCRRTPRRPCRRARRAGHGHGHAHGRAKAGGPQHPASSCAGRRGP